MVKMGVFLAYKNYEIISVATGKVHVFKFHQRCPRANGRGYQTILNIPLFETQTSKIFFRYLLLVPPLATSFECSNFLRILDRASNLSILTLVSTWSLCTLSTCTIVVCQSFKTLFDHGSKRIKIGNFRKFFELQYVKVVHQKQASIKLRQAVGQYCKTSLPRGQF